MVAIWSAERGVIFIAHTVKRQSQQRDSLKFIWENVHKIQHTAAIVSLHLTELICLLWPVASLPS